MEKLILASGSPRRKELLTLGGVDFTVESAEVVETYPDGLSPEEIVLYLSALKARAVSKLHPGKTVLGADTIVTLDNEILGKPKDASDAKRMLSELSGRTHEVFTGVCITDGAREERFTSMTEVTFFDLSEEEIEAYVASKEPLDKAGAYGIQGKGALLVRKINGDYSNVVGLPLSETVRRLKAFRKEPEENA